MSDPATMMEAGSATSAVGSLASGFAGSQSASYNAAIQGMNSQMATQSANLAGAAGSVQAENSELQTRAQVGSIKANQAAGNITVNQGSAAKVDQSADEVGMQNAMTIRSNAARAAYGYETNAVSDQAQAELDKMQAQQDIAGGLLKGSAGLLSGTGQASEYAKVVAQQGIGTGESAWVGES